MSEFDRTLRIARTVKADARPADSFTAILSGHLLEWSMEARNSLRSNCVTCMWCVSGHERAQGWTAPVNPQVNATLRPHLCETLINAGSFGLKRTVNRP